MPKKGTDGKYHSKVVPAKGAKPIYFSAKTLKEFNEKRQQIISEYRENGIAFNVKRQITFSAFAKEWWNDIKLPRITKHNTRKAYETCLNKKIFPYFTQKSVRAIRFSDLQKCVDQAKGQSRSSAEMIIIILRQICEYAVRERVMPANYAYGLQLPATSKNEERLPLTNDQAKAFRKTFGCCIGYPILYYTGMRIGELLGLQWKDIDFDRMRIHVQRTRNGGSLKWSEYGGTKTKAGTRYIPMPEELAVILFAQRGLPEQPIVIDHLGRPMCRSVFRRNWKELVRSNPLLAMITPHWLRHNYAAGLYLAGIPGQVSCIWIGHERAATTFELYTHLKYVLEGYNDSDYHLTEALKKVAKRLRTESKMYENIL